MTGFERFHEAAMALVDAVLDRPSADPDDDAAKAARALLHIDPTAPPSSDAGSPIDVERELSCLGCGLIREPSTWDATSHAYLCVECVGAIRVRHDPPLVASYLSDHFASTVIPSFGGWDAPVRYEDLDSNGPTGTVKVVAPAFGHDSYRERVARLCERLLVHVGPSGRPARTNEEVITDLADQLRGYADRLDRTSLAAISDEGPADPEAST